ncbi:diguanylate cyclase domain-containing protein [Actinoplanes sp. CA-252034]|uniref:diguanylate cyclase domain-containing protein n=1 Tax=Actinoplanes sp. CA-252034 TaxID=3239906 RepID=UPI003D99C216
MIVVAAVFQLIVPFVSPPAGRSLSDAIIVFLAGAAAVGFGRRIRAEQGRGRAAMTVATASTAMWATANALFLAGETHPLPVAGVAGAVLSVAAALLLPVGMHLSSPPLGAAEGFRGLFDVAAVSGAVLALTWLYVLDPARGAVAGITDSGYTAALIAPEVVAATVALVMMSRNLPEASGDGPRLLGSAAVVLAIAALLGLRNQVVGQPWHTGGAGAGFVLAAGLVMIASRVRVPESAPTGTDRHFAGRWVILPYVPILLAVVTTAAELLRDDMLPAPVVWILLVTFTLILGRQFMTVAIVGRLAVTLEQQQAALAYQAHHDALTGLHNRAAFNDLGRRMVETAGAGAVLLLDLDGFKPVNDRLGHAAGDDVLVTVAARLTETARPGDLVVRLGGDEFALVLTTPATDGTARELGDRILTAVAAPIGTQGERVTVGGSIGLAAGAHPLSELLRRADIAMYEAKAAGKGTIRPYRDDAADPIALARAG